MKIIDCFIFFNEVDMLKYRLSILDKVVDKFILVESRTTFSGLDKELYYNKNKKMFEKYNDKIIHVIVDMPYKKPSIDYSKKEQWENEYFQRDSIEIGLKQLELNNEDYIMISDIDEIPDPVSLSLIKEKNIIIEAGRLEQDGYYYNLNTRFDKKWYYAIIMSYKKYLELNKSPHKCRHSNDFAIVEKGGWHLSFFGDTSFVQKKIKSYSHQEYNTEPYISSDHIKKCITKGDDLYSRNKAYHSITKVPIKDNKYLPPEHDTQLKRYCLI